MDNMTIIAVASIVTAGITTGFGTMGACTFRREGGCNGINFIGSAT